ncbi:uncharacterized protein LOC131693869 [Topomyia yanbarensis]|uniref:uncharacterized protein LOC131693869 n=1 Tax=Topomyia yanbarensis TaxID=2498891 RepID=UPI00273AAB33|nr:uncharacterized protein LOC131693869 [Topomyia yanbarensis]
MYNGGKYVLAPTADGSDQNYVGENQSDISSVCSVDLEVAAHETVESDCPILVGSGDMNERVRRLEEALKNFTDKRLSESNPMVESAGESEKLDFEPAQHASPTERGCNIRWDLIPKFPQDIPSNKLWENWQSFIENFEIATSLSSFTGSADRAKLLYLSLGKSLQNVISAANLQPNYRDPRCYSALVAGVNNYFKSITDTAAEHERFQAMRQMKGESIVTFHAKLTQKVRLCGYSPADQSRFVLAQLLKGMQNRELAMAARTYGHDASYIVQAATRTPSWEDSGFHIGDPASLVLENLIWRDCFFLVL